MPYDALMVSKIVKEIDTPTFLTGIHQGKRGVVIFSLKGEDMILDMNVWPHVHLTEKAEVSSDNPTPFISILRSHLKGGILKKVEQVNFDRIIKFTVEVKNLIGELETFEIYHEVTGAFGNLVLTKDGVCISAFKNVVSDKRTIVKGAKYVPPIENRKGLEELNLNIFDNQSGKLHLFLVKNIRGLSKRTAIEIAKRAQISFDSDVEALSASEKEKVLETIKEVFVQAKEKGAYVLIENSVAKDVYSFAPAGEWKYFDNASEAIEYFLNARKKHSVFESKKTDLLKKVKRFLRKTESTLEKIRKEIHAVKNADEFKRYGELIISQLYNLPKRAEHVDVTDWENGEKVRIELDPRIDVSKNAKRFFERYSKMKKKEEGVKKRLRIMEKRLVYFQQLLDDVQNAASIEELFDIENELVVTGFMKKSKKRMKKVKESNLLEVEYNGFKILIGKNNIQNDRITTKIASHDDLWFHAREVPGAHVVVVSAGREIPENVIKMAASLAAGHCRYKESPWVDVDYTKVKNVSKPKRARPGFVLYKKFKTIKVRPCKEISQCGEW